MVPHPRSASGPRKRAGNMNSGWNAMLESGREEGNDACVHVVDDADTSIASRRLSEATSRRGTTNPVLGESFRQLELRRQTDNPPINPCVLALLPQNSGFQSHFSTSNESSFRESLKWTIACADSSVEPNARSTLCYFNSAETTTIRMMNMMCDWSPVLMPTTPLGNQLLVWF